MPMNEFGQPIGPAVSDWTRREHPSHRVIVGRYCSLDPLDVGAHAAGLWQSLSPAGPSLWTYMGVGPFDRLEDFREYLSGIEESRDPLYFAVVDHLTRRAVGFLSLMRIDRDNGVIEIGWVTFSPRMQRTRMSTEAHALLLSHVFDELHYRRCEWKCDSLNAPSQAAARRLGFEFEGVFSHAVVYKGRNRDTAWFSLTEDRWPARKRAIDAWLSPQNFVTLGLQKRPLGSY